MADITGLISPSMLSLCGDQSHVVAALVESVAGAFRLVGWQMEVFGQSQSLDQVHEPYIRVARQLGEQFGRTLWDDVGERPYIEDPEPALGLHLGHVAVAAQPLPPLRIWVAGLSELESLAAVEDALSTALCQPVGRISFRSPHSPGTVADMLQASAPDVVIVAGGYDLPDLAAQEPVLELCDLLAQALGELSPEHRPRVVYAGNRWAAGEALDLWAGLPGGVQAEAVENILPRPGVHRQSPLTVSLSRIYWRRCQGLPAVRTMAAWSTPPAQLRSFSWCFVQTVRLWREVQALEDLYGLFCGRESWLHVWASAEVDGVYLRFTRPGATAPENWPPLSLLSGRQIDPALSARVRWLDPEGLAPAIGNLGQFSPEVAYQVLAGDILLEQ